jgi:hypothetical protein
MTYEVERSVDALLRYCYSCHFEHAGEKYFADLRYTYDCGNECMIFREGEWGELYCRRRIPTTEEQLIECIEEFVAGLEAEEET